ncbi:MAG: OmpA family protein [Dysgonamonadaceae bacterium]|jgi:outer membrane protein OmpA-like peptidoglycan-associated protein|nr:OmpA family protein [Dysgonamonadaceae bacterium]
MKTIFIFFIFLSGFFTVCPIQGQKMEELLKKNNNWFVQLGAGGQGYLRNNESKTDFQKRISVMPVASVGRWMNPYWGMRMRGQGGSLRGLDSQGFIINYDKYYNVHLNAMWNLSNQLTGYSSTRFFHFIPYAGLGFAHRFQLHNNQEIPQKEGVMYSYYTGANALSVNGGIQLGFRLSKRICLDFDLGASLLPDYFDRVIYQDRNEAIVSASGGITLKLGQTDFKAIELVDQIMINELNKMINQLHTELKMFTNFKPRPSPPCSLYPAAPPTAPDISETTEITLVPNVVFFSLNSAKVDDNQQAGIFNMVEFIHNNGGKIKVIGYADKNSGSSIYNMNLSEKRAKAVANELITRYKVASHDIIVEWKGDEEQPYRESEWNRVVIMIPQ